MDILLVKCCDNRCVGQPFLSPTAPAFDKESFMAKLSKATSKSQSNESVLELVRTLAAIIKETEPLLNSHSERVADNCANFCEEFKLLQEDEIFDVYVAGRLHDIGLIFFPETLQKDDKRRSDDEEIQMRKHPVISLRLISVANSPVYRGIQEIRSLREAIPRMGLKETLNIIIAISNKSLYTTDRVQFRILMDKFWVHSLASAYGSKLIAEKLKLEDSAKFLQMDADTLGQIGEEVKGIIQDVAHLF